MTGPAVAPPSNILSGDEWERRSYAPHRLATDPTKPAGTGRILTGDEWDRAHAAPSLDALKLPPLPTFAADATRTPASEQTAGTPIANPILGPIMRQLVDPVLEHPLQSAPLLALTVPGVAAAAPVAATAAGVGMAGLAVTNIARYGWQKVHEEMMSPEDRALSEANPNRISGESAAMQAILLGLAPLIHVGVKGVKSTLNFGEGMTEAGAEGLKPLTRSAFLETPKGAEVLGSTAAQHGLPATSSPFPPATELDAAWKEGHSAVSGEPVTPPASNTPASTAAAATPTPEASATPPLVTPPAEPNSANPLAPIEGTGDVKTRGLAAGVERQAIQRDLTDYLGDLPQYATLSMKDQAARSADLLATDYQRARRIALGNESAPEGLLPESVFVAVENRAITEGDVATLRDLASGQLTERATTMGQSIRTLGERNPDSPVKVIEDLTKLRGGGKEAAGAIRGMVDELKVHLDDAHAITSDAWQSFVDSLRC